MRFVTTILVACVTAPTGRGFVRRQGRWWLHRLLAGD